MPGSGQGSWDCFRGLPHSVPRLRDTGQESQWVLVGGAPGQVRPNLTLLFLMLLVCSFSLSMTRKCWAPGRGSFHCCCHRSGTGGISGITPYKWWVCVGASQPHRVPVYHSRVLEKVPVCTCASKRYYQAVESEEQSVRQSRRGVQEGSRNRVEVLRLATWLCSALCPEESHTTSLSFDFPM